MNSELVFNPTVPDIDMYSFQKQDWTYSVYLTPGVDLNEEVPPNMPEPLGLPFLMWVFVVSDHAGESVIRLSRRGFIFFLNSETIYCHYKKQTSCDTSTFRIEFLALNQITEYTRGLCYKLRVFGITLTEPSFFMVTIIHCCEKRLPHIRI